MFTKTENSQMGSHANTSHNLKLIDSAFRCGIMQNSPIDAATSAFDLLGGYPGGRIRPDGEAGDTSFPALDKLCYHGGVQYGKFY